MKKTIIMLLLSALSCAAQYRYTLSPAGAIGTNAWIGSSSNQIYNSSVDVGATTVADVQVSFRLLSNTGYTNIVRLAVDKSLDATGFFGTEYLTNWASGTNGVTNRFRVSVTNAAFLRVQSVTNGNADPLTNFNIYIGRKIGL